MEGFLTIVSSVAALAFWVGLIKPKWVGMPNRKKSSGVYLLICVLSAGLNSFMHPKQQTPEEVAAAKEKSEQQAQAAKAFKYQTTTLNEYQRKPQQEREAIVAGYLVSEDLQASASTVFYNCLSEYTATKSDGLQLGLVMGWCKDDYKKDPHSLDDRINFDTFNSNFSGWDGSYRPLETAIKESMNDEDSYKHVKTTYRILKKGTPHAIVTTTFRGTNVYGAVVKQTIAADVDIKTGQIIEILDQQ